MNRIINVLVFCIMPCFCYSQRYTVSNTYVGIEQGLSSKEVFCTVKDPLGFIWFGTRNGLNRYDGKKFIHFTKEQNGLQGNSIKQLAIGPNQTLFILYSIESTYWLSAGKIDVLDINTLEFEPFQNKYPNCGFNVDRVLWIDNFKSSCIKFVLTAKNELWSLENSKFEKTADLNYVVDGDVNYWNTIDLSVFDGNYSKISFIDYWPGNYLIGNKQFNLIGEKQGFWRPFKFNSDGTILYANLTLKKMGKLLIPQNEIQILNYNNFQLPEEFNKIRNDSGSFYKNSNGNWYVFYKGTELKLLDRQEFDKYKIGRIYQIGNDGLGNFWLCTSAGVLKIKVTTNYFNTLFISAENAVENQARGIILTAKGMGFANINNYIYCYKGTTLIKKIYVGDYQYGLFRHAGNLYSCGFDLQRIDTVNLTAMAMPNTRLAGFILCGISLNDSIVLLAYKEGMKLYNTNRNRMEKNLNRFYSAYFLKRKKDGQIWVCGEDGLMLLDKNANPILNYTVQNKNGPNFPSRHFTDILELENGTIWLTTNGSGLIKWNKKTNAIKQLLLLHGLPSNVLYGILPDANGNLWISSENGLIDFNPNTETIKIYYQRNGLNNNEFNRMSRYMDWNGWMYFGSINGIVKFNPADIRLGADVRDVPFNIISINQFISAEDKFVDITKKYRAMQKIVLHPGDKIFSVEFQLLDFENWQNVYAYKIEGIDRDWIFTHENTLRFSNLPYGEFKLILKAKNIHGLWCKNTIEIPLKIVKPFYKKWWFITLLVMSILTISYFIVRLRIQKLENQSKALELQVFHRTTSLNQALKDKEMLMGELHHRVKNNLQVVLGLLDLQSRNSESSEVKSALKDGQNRMKSILLLHQNLYKNESYQTAELQLFVTGLIDQLRDAFDNPQQPAKIELKIADIGVPIEKAVSLGILLNELITNAYKYAKEVDGNLYIKISLVLFADYLEFEYADSGKPPEDFWLVKKQKSLGIVLIQDMFTQLNATPDVFVTPTLTIKSKLTI